MSNNQDVEVNITNPQTNQTIGTAPAKFVEFTYNEAYGIETYKQSALLVLANDTNTGYILRPILSLQSNQELPDFSRQMLDSFELMAPAGEEAPAATRG
jgi:hypothetical protein